MKVFPCSLNKQTYNTLFMDPLCNTCNLAFFGQWADAAILKKLSVANLIVTLNLPEAVIATAKSIFKKFHYGKHTERRNTLASESASLYIACRLVHQEEILNS